MKKTQGGREAGNRFECYLESERRQLFENEELLKGQHSCW